MSTTTPLLGSLTLRQFTQAGGTISVFATMPDGTRKHERYQSRDEAAKGIRDCRSKGGADINIFDPWLPKTPKRADVLHIQYGT